MIPSFTLEDVKVIFKYLGVVLVILSFIFLLPVIVGIAFGEKNALYDFLIGFFITLDSGLLLITIFKTQHPLNWTTSVFLVPLVWLGAMVFSAIPLYLSGHYLSFLDACFETMSGFATTGLTLVKDLETLSLSHNFFRHLIMFVGGQGIIIVALSVLFKPGLSSLSMYYAEARQEKILPSIINTSRFIWSASLIYLVIGSTSLWFVLFKEGFPLWRSLIYSLCIFMACFDTGGFTPFSQNISYFHSFYVEIICALFMILGATNFALRFAIWRGDRKEFFKNIEVRTFLFNMVILFLLISLFLPYKNPFRVFREGFFLLLSAHTGTGFSTVMPQAFFENWQVLSILFITLAMSFGGGICSTTGGIKLLRIGVIFKSISLYIRQAISSPHAYLSSRFHHLKDNLLEDVFVKGAFVITFLYLASFIIGTCAGVFFGYDLLASFFESVSSTCNVGLSSGITNPYMPNLLKVIYILQMWLGRLEFVAVMGIWYYLIFLRK